MKRRHLFEFHERRECPAFIRESVVETLGNGLRWGGYGAIMGPAFEEFMAQASPAEVLDLCSGSGEPAANLLTWLKGRGSASSKFILSDLFPNHPRLELTRAQQPDALSFHPSPVDATSVGEDLAHDARMMVNAFHHFDTEQARAILEDCAAKEKSIFIFEGTPRGWWPFFTLALSMPSVVVALLLNPFLAPRHKLLKFVFTYLCPLIPLAFMWDSVITNWRTYTQPELNELTRSIPAYRWTYREVPFGQGARAVAFFGVPQSRCPDSREIDMSELKSSRPKPTAPPFALMQAMGMANDPVGYLAQQQSKSGDPFCLRFPSVGDVYFSGHPEGARDIFTADRDVFEPPEFNPVAPILGDHSLILLKGERHRKERKMMMPHFAGDRMRAYEDIIHDLSREEIASWQEGREFSAFDMTQSIILQVIFQGIFGVRDATRRQQFKTMVVNLLTDYTTPLAVLPFLRQKLGGLGPWSKFLRSRDAFDALLMEEIQTRRESGVEGREDILSLLMTTRYDDGTTLSDLELIEEIRTLLVGGHDTSSNTLAWAFYFILSSPEILQRIRDEVATLGPSPSPSELAKLPYLGAVCNEALRIYPPVPFALRRVLKPFTLRGVKLDPGDNLAIAMVLLHRNPKVWDEPEVFKPQRFIDNKYTLYDFAPYGGGVRRCIGAAFATHAMKIVIGTVCHYADLQLARPVKARPVAHNITMGPNVKIPLVYRGKRGSS